MPSISKKCPAPGSFYEKHVCRQPVIVIDDELDVSHCKIPFVPPDPVLCSVQRLRIVHLVYKVGYVTEVQVQPGCILRCRVACRTLGGLYLHISQCIAPDLPIKHCMKCH
jgi:hypothetical protein